MFRFSSGACHADAQATRTSDVHPRALKEFGIPPSFDEMKDALDLALEVRHPPADHGAGGARLHPPPAQPGAGAGSDQAAGLDRTRRLSGRKARFAPSVIEGSLGPSVGDAAGPRVGAATTTTHGRSVIRAGDGPHRGRYADRGDPAPAIPSWCRRTCWARASITRSRCAANSMIEAGIFDGDTVIIRKQDTANTGEIIVALVDDEEATLKRLRRKGASIALEAANPAYETRIFGPTGSRCRAASWVCCASTDRHRPDQLRFGSRPGWVGSFSLKQQSRWQNPARGQTAKTIGSAPPQGRIIGSGIVTNGVEWVAVDWGTSNLRAWGIDAGGNAVFSRASPQGMGKLTPDQYPAVLTELLADAVDHPVDALICGMAGARQGWLEAPYLDAPAELTQLAAGAVSPAMPADTIRPRILPGICLREVGAEDVMRGEETQLLGLAALRPGFDGLVVMPGTHSKWALLEGTRLTRFSSAMTGEIYEVLKTHSVLRHSLQGDLEGPDRDAGFEAGLDLGLDRPDRLTGLLFKVRAGALLSGRTAPWCAGFLSGLLIGAEIGGHRDWIGSTEIPLVGSVTISKLYQRAFRRIGISSRIVDATDATLAGLKAARQG